MRIYVASNSGNEDLERDLLFKGHIRHRLLSFGDIFGWSTSTIEFWTKSPDAPAKGIFFDSGAFSVATTKVEIDINKYMAFIKEHSRIMECYASLDVIGDWKASAVNYEIMKANGLDPIPTFHMNSPFHELRRLLSITDYVALGGCVGAYENDLRPWLDECFSHIRDFWPKKIHVFGLIAQWALERYPVFSADASSVIVSAGKGRCFKFHHGKFMAIDWQDYARETYDGNVMDFISDAKAPRGSAYRGRRIHNAHQLLKLQRYITDHWALHGIVWEE